MPYIVRKERNKFTNHIKEVLGILQDPNDNLYVKGEYFGYFVNRCTKRYLSDPEYTKNAFNSAFFNEGKKKSLANAADSIAAMINRSDPISGAGSLTYAFCAVLWGFLGEAENFSYLGYGPRTYLRGILGKIRGSIVPPNSGSQRDATMAFRRHLVILGVLDDVITETYRRKTSNYEDTKLQENGDVWENGKLILEQESEQEI